MYHKQLSVILESLMNSKDELKNVAISFDNKIDHHHDISCPVLYVISDTKGADKICGQYGSHNLKIQCHCRMCDVNSENLDNPIYNFNYLKFSNLHHIALHGTEEERRKFSQHEINNAFYNVNFGGQDKGLLFATPPDILHVLQKSIVEWSVKAVINNITDGPKEILDNLAIEFKRNHCQQYQKIFPKTSFASGFTNLSNV